MSLFNTIFLSENSTNVNTVKHEWGHTVQETLVGPQKYLFRIGIPSLIGAAFKVDDYYSQPWERFADYFGGANNSHSKYSKIVSTLYFMLP